MVRLYASRTDPDAAYDPVLSSFLSSKQALAVSIASGGASGGLTVYEERADRLVELVIEGEVGAMGGWITTLRYYGVGCFYLQTDTQDELDRLEGRFSNFAAIEMELVG